MNGYIDNTGKVLRALRKYMGINQISFAEVLEVNQSTLSRVEKGMLELTAFQWVSLVEKYKLDARCIVSGKIEQLSEIKFKIGDENKINGFKMPKKYLKFRGSRVRSIRPFLNYLVSHVGEDKLNELLISKKIDPDYFIIQNLPISIELIQDIFLEIVNLGLLNKSNYTNLLADQGVGDIHSYFINSLKETTDGEVAFKKLIKYVKNQYEINADYEYLGKNNDLIMARDADFMSEFNLSEEFKIFRKLYNLEHFRKLKYVLKFENEFELEEDSNLDQWLIKVKI